MEWWQKGGCDIVSPRTYYSMIVMMRIIMLILMVMMVVMVMVVIVVREVKVMMMTLHAGLLHN